MAASTRTLRRLAYNARHVPVLGSAVAGAYRTYFNKARGNVRLFRGLYPTFDAAARDVPSGGLSSYDNEASARRVLGEWLGVFPNDYPVLFWLTRLLAEHSCVFDWGGNVGLKYFAYRPYLDYPAALRWIVGEVAAVVELGKDVARREGATALEFTTGLDALAEADVLLAAGVIQFVDDPLARLAAAPSLPEHLILNKVPVYDMPSAVTLHNMGTAFSPYHLFNRTELLDAIDALGYRLADEWRSPDVACEIPFYARHSIGAYSGFYFVRRR